VRGDGVGIFCPCLTGEVNRRESCCGRGGGGLTGVDGRRG